MPFLVGRFPVIRTQKYLDAGRIILNERIKVFIAHVNTGKQPRHVGLQEFITWHFPQLQHKNPDVHCFAIRNLFPTPFIRCFLDDGEEVIVDVDNCDRKEILNHVIQVLGKPEKVLKAELLAQEKKENPANFGFLCKNHCICQVVGQIPCPGIVGLPRSFTGKYKREQALARRSG